MWKKLLNTDLCLAFSKGNHIEIYVTDFITIWSKRFFNASFLECVKNNNPRLQIADSILLEKAIDMFTNVETLKKINIEHEEDTLVLHLIKSYKGYLVKLKINLIEGPKELFFKKITCPLLRSAQELVTSQHKLCDLLLKKDIEIKEYKEKGGFIDLRHIKTQSFDDKVHLSKYDSYSKNFAFTDMNTAKLQEKANSVVKEVKAELLREAGDSRSTTVFKVKEEPNNSTPRTSSNGSLNSFELNREDKSETSIKQEPVSVKEEPMTQSQDFTSLNNNIKEEIVSQPRPSSSIFTSASPRKKRKMRDL